MPSEVQVTGQAEMAARRRYCLSRDPEEQKQLVAYGDGGLGSGQLVPKTGSGHRLADEREAGREVFWTRSLETGESS